MKVVLLDDDGKEVFGVGDWVVRKPEAQTFEWLDATNAAGMYSGDPFKIVQLLVNADDVPYVRLEDVHARYQAINFVKWEK